LWELDILQHSIRKLETYEEIHIVVTRYVCCDGAYVREELKRLGWTKAELKRRRKGDASKVALARRLRAQTAVSLRWIAENLYMGTWTHVSNRLYHCR
jgi:hypothetical protein